ncbi:MAG: DUF3050 domain-containing protein [Rhizomicrobium sp.]
MRHFIYCIERHVELDGDSHGPMGRELLEGLVADSPQRDERALRAACNSVQAPIELLAWHIKHPSSHARRVKAGSEMDTPTRSNHPIHR